MGILIPITASLHVMTFFAFAWAIAKLFKRDRQLPPLMRLLTVVGSVSSIAMLSLMIFVPNRVIGIMYVAIAIYLMSLSLFIWTCRTTWTVRLPIAFSDHKPMGVQRRGPYVYVRHPFYVSYGLAYIGGAVACNHPAAWGVAGVMLCIYWRLAVAEERELLAQPIGNEYAQYMVRTGRFIPSVSAFISSEIQRS